MSLSADSHTRAHQRAAIAQKRREKREPNAMLAAHLRVKLEGMGHHVERYDPDFIMGTIMLWLADHDAILTSSGVEPEGRVPDWTDEEE